MTNTPKCDTPDQCRIQDDGPSWTTCVYYPPVLDGHGNNLNPDGNSHHHPVQCSTCGRKWDAGAPESKA
jgi:hypothetical protein